VIRGVNTARGVRLCYNTRLRDREGWRKKQRRTVKKRAGATPYAYLKARRA